ncbi:hypothetical protein I8J29_22665 [Paenibacillus sp. MWE-103]|uniref:PD-(D/E)XK family protein DUF4420 n=1 Tax=Paenibacillus artemisiicola TaxID=1172618 RepID=A0ABS3WFX4_9BACL|nr:hypothetical protein [Paenibacillus artemisiicola]MBO7747011.1 hypothetical protein [Paenibacillus artemisiicola]
MSTQDRRIGFFGIVFDKFRSDETYFDREFFKNFIIYILGRPTEEQIISIPQYNKAIALDRYALFQLHADYVANIVFKSCKYNHSPDYMSSIDGTERASDKQNHEGEKEKTHLCIRISTYEAQVILEERRSGVSIREIVSYLNKQLRHYFAALQQPRTFKLIHNIEPSNDFLEMVNGMRDIKIAELYTTKTVMGSEMMNLMELEDFSMKEDIIITSKAKPRESLLKRNFTSLYNSFIGGESRVSRIRLYGHDEDNNYIRLDTSNLKKVDYVTVELETNGTVNTESMFTEMYEILEITEEHLTAYDG